MKNKIMKRISYYLIAIICLFAYTGNIHAAGSASVGFTGNNSAPKDSNISIKLTVSNITGTNGGITSMGGYLTFDSSYLQYVSGTGISDPYTFQINKANYKIAGLDTTLDNGIKDTTSVFTFVFKALKTGSTNISFTQGKLTDASSVVTTSYTSKSITITGALSSNNNLASLKVEGYTITPTFDKATVNYSLTVPNSVSSVNIVATAEEATSTISGTGTKTVSVGNNTMPITVTAENGSSKTYTIIIKREAEAKVETSTNNTTQTVKSSDNYLKTLSINNGELSPKFDKSINSYDITISSDINSLDIDYITNNTKSKVLIEGNKDLLPNKTNIVTIKVTAEDNSTRVYTINVVKSEKKSDNKLKEITLDKGTLSPNFNSEVFEYDVKLEEDTNEINVKATTSSDKSTVEISGNKDLKEGRNVILLKVTDENGFIQYYRINVDKKITSKEFSIFGLTKAQSLFIIIFSLLCIICIIITIIIFSSKDKNEDEKMVLPNIEIKPEFNFNSKNNENNDINDKIVRDTKYKELEVEDAEIVPQIEEQLEEEQTEEQIEESDTEEIDAEPVNDAQTIEEIESDSIFDDVVTKDELIDAIEEKDPRKLKILLKQELLNREKEELKQELKDENSLSRVKRNYKRKKRS